MIQYDTTKVSLTGDESVKSKFSDYSFLVLISNLICLTTLEQTYKSGSKCTQILPSFYLVAGTFKKEKKKHFCPKLSGYFKHRYNLRKMKCQITAMFRTKTVKTFLVSHINLL